MEYDKKTSEQYLLENGYFKSIPAKYKKIGECLKTHKLEHQQIYFSSDFQMYLSTCPYCNFYWLDVFSDHPYGGTDSWITPLSAKEVKQIKEYIKDQDANHSKIRNFKTSSKVNFVRALDDVFVL
jgi:hypothetical protein